GYEIRFVDITDTSAVERAIADFKPGCVLMETVSNPILRVGEIDRIAVLTRAAGAALVVDNTFSSPYLIRPLELGAHLSVHSATKYLAGHGDVLGGLIVADAEHLDPLRAYSRIVGPVMGPFESYLTMRGIKTFPLRMQRQCANANAVAAWLARDPRDHGGQGGRSSGHRQRPWGVRSGILGRSSPGAAASAREATARRRQPRES
ncbi:MAG: PLP-dependent transferase, partial [Chloroflexi bacterium]|nr:PLP-dependent transferase [Chloroflexota bacterium]